MKHAYLIIAHNEPIVLQTLLSVIDHKDNDVFLHIDKRAESLYLDMKSYQMKYSFLNVLSYRMRVYWGDISQVEVEFLLMESALAHGSYDYIHLLSGVDLPIKDQAIIHQFFQAHQGKEFVSFWNDEGHRKDLERKVYKYHFFTKYLKNKNELSHKLSIPLRNLTLIIQKLLHIKRNHKLQFYKGSNWFSITSSFCTYIVSKKQDILQTFKHTLCPDEIFLQTYLMNSPYKDSLYSIDKTEEGNQRKIDWTRGSPYVWKETDFDEIMHSNLLFARKFSGHQSGLLNKMKNHLLMGLQ